MFEANNALILMGALKLKKVVKFGKRIPKLIDPPPLACLGTNKKIKQTYQMTPLPVKFLHLYMSPARQQQFLISQAR